MTSNRHGKPLFNTVEIPQPKGPANTAWFRRQIIFDQPKMTIYIQVQWDGGGMLNRGEYERIKAGLWAEYVPKDYGPVIGAAIANGFTVQPVAVVGGTHGEMFNITQIVNLDDGRTTMKEPGQGPISDTNISQID